MAQTWDTLLFAHWRVEPGLLQRAMPSQLPVDTFDGSAWLGVTPFVVRDLRLRGTPPVPGPSYFTELNVRTYVTLEGKPGIYFFSLDAASSAAVSAARRAYRLPYHRARMQSRADGAWIEYRHSRTQRDGPPAEFNGRYRPTSEVFNARAGSLEAFLTERYCLYTLDERVVVQRGDIHHPPWPLQEAVAEIERNTMGEQIRVELESEPLLHFAQRQDVLIWPLGGLGA